MKNTSILFFVAVALLLSLQVSHAQTKDSTSSATTAPLDETEMKNVKKIIDLVASNSSEQKLVSKVGIIGTVSEKTTTTINLKTPNGNRIVEIDDITKFSDPDSKTFGISDIKNGQTIGVIGVLNKVSNHVLGRFVDRITSLPSHFDGVITEIDRKNFQFTAVDENGNKRVLDIQTTSKILSFSKDDGLIKAGFSKGEVGERVYASGFPDSKIKGQLEVSRLILLPELPLSAKFQKYVQPTEEEATETPTAKPTVAR